MPVSSIINSVSSAISNTLAAVTSNGKWTIMTEDGSTAIDFQSFVNIDVTSENPVIKAAVEQGGFVDYNKVNSPKEIGLMLSVQGTPSHLQEVISQIDELCSNTTTVNIITPYCEFKEYAMEKYQYSQDSTTGVNVLYFNFSFVQINQVSTAYTNVHISKKQSRGQQQTTETSILSSLLTG